MRFTFRNIQDGSFSAWTQSTAGFHDRSREGV